MTENYQLNRVLGNMKRDNVIGRSLGLEKKQAVVRGIMEKQGISVDPSKLKNYKKEKFLKAISKETTLGYYDKKAFQSAYGAQKTQPVKTNVGGEKKISSVRERYEEIMNKGKDENKLEKSSIIAGREKSNVLHFDVSNKNMRDANGLLVGIKEKTTNPDDVHKNQHMDEKNDNVREALKRIQA